MLVAVVLAAAVGCGPQPATIIPTGTQLAGRYTTKDKRAPTAALEVNADGTFRLMNWPKGDLSGTWQASLDASGTCGLTLRNEARNYSESGHQVFGVPGDFRIVLYLSDPDEGVVVFVR